MNRLSRINGITPIARGVPPRTFSYKLPMYPRFPKNLNTIFSPAVPNNDTINTNNNSKNMFYFLV